MNRIQFTTQAFKTFVKDVKAPLAELRDELKAILTPDTVVYVPTFWHVDGISGWNWYSEEKKALALEVRSDWEKELREESKQDGVVALFRVVVPSAYTTSNDTINDYLEDLAALDTFADNGKLVGEYRQNMGSRTGY